MTILLLGATGRTGKWLLEEALAHGHTVHALVRDRKKLTVTSPQLVVFEGLPTDEAILLQAMQGCEAVLSALNISRRSDFPWSPLRSPLYLLSDTMRPVIKLGSQASIRRIIVTSAWGVGDTRRDIPGWFRWFIDHSNIGPAYADHARQEELLMRSGLQWTIVRPTGLTNGKKIKPVKASIHNNPRPSLTISRRNVALFMLDALETNKYAGEAVVISG